MAKQVKIRRGDSTALSSFTPAQSEMIHNTTTNEVVIGDGVKVGGHKIGGDIKSVNSIKTLPTGVLPKDKDKFDVTGFYENTTIGGGQFIYAATRSVAEHNGGTVIAVAAIIAWDGTQADIATLLNWTGTGTGCFIMISGCVINDIKILIPSQYATLQDAIDEMSCFNYSSDAKVRLTIETGHQPSSGITVTNGDFSMFWIESESAEVTVHPSWDVTEAVVYATYATAPVLNSLWNCNGLGSYGYSLRWNSKGMVRPSCGVKNIPRKAGQTDATHGSGLLVWDGSTCYAPESIFTGCFRNVNLSTSSSLEARNSFFSGSVNVNALPGESAANVMAGRSSSIHIVNSDLSGGDDFGLVASRSVCGANQCNITNNNIGVRVDHSGVISLQDSNISNCTAQGVLVEGVAIVTAQRANINNNGTNGVDASNGATINCADAIINSNGNHGVRGEACTINIKSATITGNSGAGVRGDALNLFAQNATITGNTANDMVGDIIISGKNYTVSTGNFYSKVNLSNANIVNSFGDQFTGYEIYSNGRISIWMTANLDRSISTAQSFALPKRLTHFPRVSITARDATVLSDLKALSSATGYVLPGSDSTLNIFITDPQTSGSVNAVVLIDGFIDQDETIF